MVQRRNNRKSAYEDKVIRMIAFTKPILVDELEGEDSEWGICRKDMHMTMETFLRLTSQKNAIFARKGMGRMPFTLCQYQLHRDRNAQIPHTLQYGQADCSCWPACGEFDTYRQSGLSHFHLQLEPVEIMPSRGRFGSRRSRI